MTQDIIYNAILINICIKNINNIIYYTFYTHAISHSAEVRLKRAADRLAVSKKKKNVLYMTSV